MRRDIDVLNNTHLTFRGGGSLRIHSDRFDYENNKVFFTIWYGDSHVEFYLPLHREEWEAWNQRLPREDLLRMRDHVDEFVRHYGNIEFDSVALYPRELTQGEEPAQLESSRLQAGDFTLDEEGYIQPTRSFRGIDFNSVYPREMVENAFREASVHNDVEEVYNTLREELQNATRHHIGERNTEENRNRLAIDIRRTMDAIRAGVISVEEGRRQLGVTYEGDDSALHALSYAVRVRFENGTTITNKKVEPKMDEERKLIEDKIRELTKNVPCKSVIDSANKRQCTDYLKSGCYKVLDPDTIIKEMKDQSTEELNKFLDLLEKGEMELYCCSCAPKIVGERKKPTVRGEQVIEMTFDEMANFPQDYCCSGMTFFPTPRQTGVARAEEDIAVGEVVTFDGGNIRAVRDQDEQPIGVVMSPPDESGRVSVMMNTGVQILFNASQQNGNQEPQREREEWEDNVDTDTNFISWCRG